MKRSLVIIGLLIIFSLNPGLAISGELYACFHAGGERHVTFAHKHSSGTMADPCELPGRAESPVADGREEPLPCEDIALDTVDLQASTSSSSLQAVSFTLLPYYSLKLDYEGLRTWAGNVAGGPPGAVPLACRQALVVAKIVVLRV